MVFALRSTAAPEGQRVTLANEKVSALMVVVLATCPTARDLLPVLALPLTTLNLFPEPSVPFAYLFDVLIHPSVPDSKSQLPQAGFADAGQLSVE